MEISSFGAKANLTLKIRTDLSGQAKGTTLLCLSPSHRSTAGRPIMWVLGWNCDISRGMDETGVWGMERSWLQIRFLMDSILILDLNALLVLTKTLTQNTLIKIHGADIVFILVVGAAKSCVAFILF